MYLSWPSCSASTKTDTPLRAKSNFRKDKRSYREILNEEDRTMIAELFRDEINLFGYEF